MAAVGLLCVVVVARGAELGEQQHPAQYEFNYAVNDPLTGDLKDQQELRDGDAVVGYYRTADADGLVRTVKYRADGVNGFQAEVVREPVAAAGVTVAAKAADPAKPADPVKPAAVVPVASAAPVLPYYYGYQPYAAYGYQPYAAYGYQPYAAYGYQPYSYPYVDGKYAPLAVAAAARK